MKDQPIEDQS